METNEFKAWFKGFSEAMGNSLPSAEQWRRINEEVEKIGVKPLSFPPISPLPRDGGTPRQPMPLPWPSVYGPVVPKNGGNWGDRSDFYTGKDYTITCK